MNARDNRLIRGARGCQPYLIMLVGPTPASSVTATNPTTGMPPASYIGNFHRGLEHNAQGELQRPEGFQALRHALESGDQADFEPPLFANSRPLVNPRADLAFDLENPDARALTMPPAPRIDSAEAAGEMAKLFWMALLRDVHFSDFGVNADVAAAAASLSALSDFRPPRRRNALLQRMQRGSRILFVSAID